MVFHKDEEQSGQARYAVAERCRKPNAINSETEGTRPATGVSSSCSSHAIVNVMSDDLQNIYS